MGSIWGPVTEIADAGVMAERCPHCERITPCLLRSVRQSYFILFVKTASSSHDNSGFCTECHQAFHCDPWRYLCVVPLTEAKGLGIEELLTRTNPILAERVRMKELIAALGGDARFAEAHQQLDELHTGELRARLLQELLNWVRLDEESRTALVQQIADRARAWKFALHIARGFPSHVGCLPGIVAGLVVWLLVFVPALALRHRLLISGSFFLSKLLAGASFFLGFVAAALTGQVLLEPQIRRWTRKVLIPECCDAKVSFASFAEVVDDLAGSPLDKLETLWLVKLNLETIRQGMHSTSPTGKQISDRSNIRI